MHQPIVNAAGRHAAAGQGTFCLVLGVALLVAGCDLPGDKDAAHKVNGSVHVAAGAPLASAESVNGSIHVAADAAVTKAATVNGGIHLGAHASATSAKTVNGSITLDEGAHVTGDVVAVNGALSLARDAEVTGRLENVAGRIDIRDAHVGGPVKTLAGDIDVEGAAHLDGGIVVAKGGSLTVTTGDGVPRIVIGPGATVQGELRFEREVKLLVSDRATIGTVTGATPVAYSGDTPPN